MLYCGGGRVLTDACSERRSTCATRVSCSSQRSPGAKQQQFTPTLKDVRTCCAVVVLLPLVAALLFAHGRSQPTRPRLVLYLTSPSIVTPRSKVLCARPETSACALMPRPEQLCAVGRRPNTSKYRLDVEVAACLGGHCHDSTPACRHISGVTCRRYINVPQRACASCSPPSKLRASSPETRSCGREQRHDDGAQLDHARRQSRSKGHPQDLCQYQSPSSNRRTRLPVFFGSYIVS